MSNRRILALRNLAERPGTKEEGVLAREILARLDGKKPLNDTPDYEAAYQVSYARYSRNEITIDEFIEALRKRHVWQAQNLQTSWMCACGAILGIGQKCEAKWRHLEIQTEIRARFSRGDRVFYNCWAYTPNCPGKVAAHVPIYEAVNNDFPWAWISVKFDHLTSARRIPVFSVKGWHLSRQPLPEDRTERLCTP